MVELATSYSQGNPTFCAKGEVSDAYARLPSSRREREREIERERERERERDIYII